MAVSTDVQKQPTSTTIETQPNCITDLTLLETRLRGGLHAEWRELVEQDPLASLFQSPGWCMPWYRCYQDDLSVLHRV